MHSLVYCGQICLYFKGRFSSREAKSIGCRFFDFQIAELTNLIKLSRVLKVEVGGAGDFAKLGR